MRLWGLETNQPIAIPGSCSSWRSSLSELEPLLSTMGWSRLLSQTLCEASSTWSSLSLLWWPYSFPIETIDSFLGWSMIDTSNTTSILTINFCSIILQPPLPPRLLAVACSIVIQPHSNDSSWELEIQHLDDIRSNFLRLGLRLKFLNLRFSSALKIAFDRPSTEIAIEVLS